MENKLSAQEIVAEPNISSNQNSEKFNKTPLKQLYGFTFKDLYQWVSDNPRQLRSRLANVKEWVNIYRGGDYIGRCIWSDARDSNIWKLSKNTSIGSDSQVIREYCIGAGGHTPYWNANAPEIAAEIDSLIARI